MTANPHAAPESLDPTDGPTAMITPATATAPRGHVIDDSARGTIFWEADSNEADGEVGTPAKAREESEVADSSQSQDWGRPFQIKWVSLNRVPFYRTRGLRNPWNANREVKIARDGTELEPNVGKRLLQMFHRPSMPGPGPGHGGYPEHSPVEAMPPMIGWDQQGPMYA